MSKVSVVIPYFQRREGILRNTVLSALRQKTDATVRVLVVDDQSPVPARTELSEILASYPQSVRIVEQKNAGAGAARNTGLDNVDPDTDYVAFLDSDDEWTTSHISRAVWALQNGYDFYFSDFYQLAQTVTAFNRAGRIRISEHRQIHPTEPIHEYAGDMVDQILTGNILGTSTIVYNFRKFPTIRYPIDYRHTGEEYIFWLRLASSTKRIAFSSAADCRYGAGVNIYSESGWGTDKYLSLVHDDIKYRKYLLGNMGLNPAQQDGIRKRIRRLRIDYAKGLFHNLINNGKVDASMVRKHLLFDPMTLFTMAFAPGVIVYEKLRRAAS
jgi:succinoglycan biosynthesis protein ExoW